MMPINTLFHPSVLPEDPGCVLFVDSLGEHLRNIDNTTIKLCPTWSSLELGPYLIANQQRWAQYTVIAIAMGFNALEQLTGAELIKSAEIIAEVVWSINSSARLVIFGMIPRPLRYNKIRNKIAMYNQALKKRALATSDFTFIDSTHNYVDSKGEPETERLFRRDQVNLSSQGEHIYAHNITVAMRPFRNASQRVPPHQHHQHGDMTKSAALWMLAQSCSWGALPTPCQHSGGTPYSSEEGHLVAVNKPINMRKLSNMSTVKPWKLF
jgi:hypothetical protein